MERFEFADSSIKVPHVGFNSVDARAESNPLFERLESSRDFYFVHSYRLVTDEPRWVTAWTEYGERFPSAVQKDNVFGTQFHPEKSQSNGLKLLRNFARIKL